MMFTRILKMIKKLLLTILAALAFFGFVEGSLAVIQLDENLRPENLPSYELPDEGTVDDNPETRATQSVILFVGSIVTQVLLFTGSIAIIFLIISGARYIFAFGKDEQIEKGKRGVFWSLMGLIIILLSYAIVQGVLQVILQVDESVN